MNLRCPDAATRGSPLSHFLTGRVKCSRRKTTPNSAQKSISGSYKRSHTPYSQRNSEPTRGMRAPSARSSTGTQETSSRRLMTHQPNSDLITLELKMKRVCVLSRGQALADISPSARARSSRQSAHSCPSKHSRKKPGVPFAHDASHRAYISVQGDVAAWVQIARCLAPWTTTSNFMSFI